MNPDEAETLKIIAKAAAGEFFAPFGNIVCKLAGESAEEIGLAFRDSVRVWRWERTLKLAEKVKRIAHKYDIQLNPVKPVILLPILDGASLEDDAELQDKWAALLVSAASRPDEEVRGFSEILRQVTPALAKFLDRALDETAEAYKTEIKKLTVGATSDAPIPVRLRDETVAKMTEAQIGQFERIGLVRADRSPGFGDPVIYMFRMTDPLYLSPLARAFVQACRPPMDLDAKP